MPLHFFERIFFRELDAWAEGIVFGTRFDKVQVSVRYPTPHVRTMERSQVYNVLEYTREALVN